MKEKLAGKSVSPNHVGPRDIADFFLVDEDEIEMTKRDVYEQMQVLIELISA